MTSEDNKGFAFGNFNLAITQQTDETKIRNAGVLIYTYDRNREKEEGAKDVIETFTQLDRRNF